MKDGHKEAGLPLLCYRQLGGPARRCSAARSGSVDHELHQPGSKAASKRFAGNPRKIEYGGMAEWSMAVVLKTAIRHPSLFEFSG
jgi:hypothetical protein